VAAPRLSSGSISVNDWQAYFESLNDQMSTFNAFMHNKVRRAGDL
jgi:hypothetical protein